MRLVSPKLSVCIPAYNRAAYLVPLLDSIVDQDHSNLEIVISEDNSPEREQIAAVVEAYRQRGVACIRYFENEQTLGFDGNLRVLFARATGDYCVMMGNDDLLCPGSLETIGLLLAQHPEVAVVIRSYGWFFVAPTRLLRQPTASMARFITRSISPENCFCNLMGSTSQRRLQSAGRTSPILDKVFLSEANFNLASIPQTLESV